MIEQSTLKTKEEFTCSKCNFLHSLPDSIAMIMPVSYLDNKDLKLFKRLYEGQDVTKMLDHERQVLEWFWKYSKFGWMGWLSESTPPPKELELPLEQTIELPKCPSFKGRFTGGHRERRKQEVTNKQSQQQLTLI